MARSSLNVADGTARLNPATQPANFDQSNRPIEIPSMRDIQSSEAKTHLPQILDEVERGETVRITRHGRVIARIVPEVDRRQETIDKAVAAILTLRQRVGKLSAEELRQMRHEGHRY
jgi:prevent-host-death family protein